MESKIAEQIRDGRRIKPRLLGNFDLTIRCKSEKGEYKSFKGATISFHEDGLSCSLQSPLPDKTKFAYIDVAYNGTLLKHSGQVAWVDQENKKCGIKFKSASKEWLKFITENMEAKTLLNGFLRRRETRRTTSGTHEADRRLRGRRFLDLPIASQEERLTENFKVKAFLRKKSTTFTAEIIQDRREWIGKLTNTKLKHIAHFSEEPLDFRGKIESPIGVAHVPLGIVGPLRINGQYARGTFFVPMAATEGALITSYTFGSHIATRSGGINVKILKDELRSDPTFVFKTSFQAQNFSAWLDSNFKRIKEIAESTSKHLQLTKISPLINGRRVIVNFHFDTADAMGMNMAYKATDVACKTIREIVHAEEFWLHSNFSAVKKTTGDNFLNGYGKSVVADVTIPRRVLAMVNTTPEEMERYYFRTLQASAQAISFGINGHFANALTAIAIACGQDAALVANNHQGVIACEVTKDGDLYYSAYLPSLLTATVGGGTTFGTARECLGILDCLGKGKSKRFAEIVAATVLAGEISVTISIVNETYIYAHETFGRNKPPEQVLAKT